MSKNFNTRIKSKHDVEANWKKATNFVPYDGEIIIYDVDDTHNSPRFKIGDNSTNVNDLPFVSAETMLTIGANSFGSGIGSGIAGESFDTALGEIAIDDMSNFTVNAATSAGASSIKFKIGGLSAALYYSYLEFLLENGYNGGILVIKGMVLPVISFTLSTTGSLSKSYYVTIQLMDGFTTTSDLTTTDYPTNLYAGVAYGKASQAFGTGTFAFADNSHTEGNLTRTLGDAAHAEGYLTSAEAMGAHAEGASTTASGSASHAEGSTTEASGQASHAEGFGTIASGEGAHAEGYYTNASGRFSHAGGRDSIASGDYCFAHGWNVEASGDHKTAFGSYTVAPDGNIGSFVCGNENNPSSGALFSVGMGGRRDAIDVFNNGTATLPQSTLDTIAARGDKAIPTVEWVNSKLTSSGGGLDIKIEDVAEKAQPYIDKIGLYAAVKDGETDKQTLLRAKLENDSWTIPIRGVDGEIKVGLVDDKLYTGLAVPKEYVDEKTKGFLGKNSFDKKVDSTRYWDSMYFYGNGIDETAGTSDQGKFLAAHSANPETVPFRGNIGQVQVATRSKTNPSEILTGEAVPRTYIDPLLDGKLNAKSLDDVSKPQDYWDNFAVYSVSKVNDSSAQIVFPAAQSAYPNTIAVRGQNGSISCIIDFDGTTWKGQAVPHSYLQRKNEEIHSKINEISNKASDVEFLSSTVSEHTSTIAALTQSVDAKKITVHQLDANSTLELKPNALYAFLKSGSSNTVTVGLQDKDTQTFTAFNAGTKDEIKMKFGVVIIPENTLGNSEAYPPSYYGVAAVDTTTLGVTTVSSKKFTVKKSDLETNTILAKTDGDGQFLVWELSF